VEGVCNDHGKRSYGIPLLFLACTRTCTNTWRETPQRTRKRTASTYQDTLCSEGNGDECCTTTWSIQPLHTKARRPLGRFDSRK